MTDIEQEDIARIKSLAVSCKEIAHELQTIYAKYVHIPKEFRTAEGDTDVYPDNPEVTEEDYEAAPDQRAILQIGTLRTTDENITIEGEITTINAVSTFTKTNGDTGRVRNIRVSDDTGSCLFPLWDSQIKDYEHLEVGDVVRIKAWKVKKWKNQLQLQLGKDFAIILISKKKGEQHIL